MDQSYRERHQETEDLLSSLSFGRDMFEMMVGISKAERDAICAACPKFNHKPIDKERAA